MASKECCSCKSVKSLTAFYKSKSSLDGHARSCKTCQRSANERWKSTPLGKQKTAEYNKKFHATDKGAALRQRSYVNRKANGKVKDIRKKAQKKYLEDANNYEQHLQRARTYQQTPEGREAARRYRGTETGKRKARINEANRRARLLQATPPWFNEHDERILNDSVEQAQHMECIIGEPIHVDHIIPLNGERVCGLHYHKNWQILPRSENCRKNNRMEE